MIADVKPFLGKGLYSLQEAALFARVNPATLKRWFFGGKDRQPALTPEIQTGEKVVTFLDFVQTLAVREIRQRKRNVSLQKIREAMTFARDRLGVPYPFAMEHTTYLWPEGGWSIVIVRPSEGPEEARQLVEASGKYKGNILLKPVVEMYLEDLHFDTASGLADEYTIRLGNGDVPITMNPHRRFGEPVLPSGYSVRTIWEAVEVEGGIAEAARAYRIGQEEVKVALRFQDHLFGTAA